MTTITNAPALISTLEGALRTISILEARVKELEEGQKFVPPECRAVSCGVRCAEWCAVCAVCHFEDICGSCNEKVGKENICDDCNECCDPSRPSRCCECSDDEEGSKCGECGVSTQGRKIRSLWNNTLCEKCGEE